jgi:muconolactone D-isomerase
LEETDMLFMVNIEVSVPADLPQKDKDDLRRRETDRALELMKANKLRRIWRIVGQVANFSVWEADSLEELHANLGSLPLYPYMKVTVTR